MVYTIDEAYQLMDRFLFQYYKTHQSESLDILLGSMIRFDDGFNDPEIENNWIISVRSFNERLLKDDIYEAMRCFLKLYQMKDNSEEIAGLIHWLDSEQAKEEWNKEKTEENQ